MKNQTIESWELMEIHIKNSISVELGNLAGWIWISMTGRQYNLIVEPHTEFNKQCNLNDAPIFKKK